jgi:hypothetical protein
VIRPSTILWIALAVGVGVGTYQLKHRMLAFEDELARINRQVTAEQQAIHVLRAEWAYITQPQRLQALAGRHLDMTTMTPAQIGRAADLPPRPPAPPTATAATPEPQQAAAPAIIPIPMPATTSTMQPAAAQSIAPAVARAPGAGPRRTDPRANAPPRNDAIGALLSQMSAAATQHANSVRNARGAAPPR